MNAKQSALPLPNNNIDEEEDAIRSADFESIINSTNLNLSSLLMHSLPPTSTPPYPPIRHRFEPPTPKPEPDNSYTLLPFPASPCRPITTTPSTSSTRRRRIVVPTSSLARQRRSRLSHKTRCLQKLIPLDRQLDNATLYLETIKYIKFLETQISVLQTMPQTTKIITTRGSGGGIYYGGYGSGGLGRLNRQQMLEVLMRSQVAQSVMYENEWCVFSAEQLGVLVEREQVVVEQRFI